jgi:hypothetical protein
VYGPTAGFHFIIYVDDLNMPQRELYFAQPPVELLRHVTSRCIVDRTFVSAMDPPGGGRYPISARIKRWLGLLLVFTLSGSVDGADTNITSNDAQLLMITTDDKSWQYWLVATAVTILLAAVTVLYICGRRAITTTLKSKRGTETLAAMYRLRFKPELHTMMTCKRTDNDQQNGEVLNWEPASSVDGVDVTLPGFCASMSGESGEGAYAMVSNATYDLNVDQLGHTTFRYPAVQCSRQIKKGKGGKSAAQITRDELANARRPVLLHGEFTERWAKKGTRKYDGAGSQEAKLIPAIVAAVRRNVEQIPGFEDSNRLRVHKIIQYAMLNDDDTDRPDNTSGGYFRWILDKKEIYVAQTESRLSSLVAESKLFGSRIDTELLHEGGAGVPGSANPGTSAHTDSVCRDVAGGHASEGKKMLQKIPTGTTRDSIDYVQGSGDVHSALGAVKTAAATATTSSAPTRRVSTKNTSSYKELRLRLLGRMIVSITGNGLKIGKGPLACVDAGKWSIVFDILSSDQGVPTTLGMIQALATAGFEATADLVFATQDEVTPGRRVTAGLIDSLAPCLGDSDDDGGSDAVPDDDDDGDDRNEDGGDDGQFGVDDYDTNEEAENSGSEPSTSDADEGSNSDKEEENVEEESVDVKEIMKDLKVGAWLMVKFVVDEDEWYYHGIIKAMRRQRGGKITANIHYPLDDETSSVVLTVSEYGELWKKATLIEEQVRCALCAKQSDL